jgi:1-pyrroline-5-carboxylate dehydrogenase
LYFCTLKIVKVMNGFFKVPAPINEPVLDYAPGSNEKIALKKALNDARSQVIDIPMFINGKEIRTGEKRNIFPPHDLKHKIGEFHHGDASHVHMAIEAAMAAKPNWENMPWEQRAAIFLKAADLLAGPHRAKMNAATMLAQSKNAYQSEIDSICELIDFLRFNVQYMTEIYADQPTANSKGVWNRLEHRALEGFTFALTPFNFTAIAGNLTSSMAMMGNVVVWKPAFTQIYSAWVIMEIFREAGLPDGVINLIYTDGPVTGDIIFNHADFAGLHFTGSTGVFRGMWNSIGANIHKYKTYPRIVGETGGKDFVLVHKSADVDTTVTALARGSFEYQGQKCSAASRVYIPSNLWPTIQTNLIKEVKSMKIGPTEDFRNFVNAVIDEKSFDKIMKYLENAKNDKDVEVICGGNGDKTNGFFIEPTILVCKDPNYITMCDELFGPVLSVYVYEENDFNQAINLVNTTSEYALTGAVISQDRNAINEASLALRHAAGNFYINDKPTGAVVGQQPFGGSRASGTNDKAGSKANLLRWSSTRTIKETLVPAKDYRYPFLNEE